VTWVYCVLGVWFALFLALLWLGDDRPLT